MVWRQTWRKINGPGRAGQAESVQNFIRSSGFKKNLSRASGAFELEWFGDRLAGFIRY